MSKSSKHDYSIAEENRGSRVGKIIVYVILLLWAGVNLFPIYWMFTFSLKSNEEIFGKKCGRIAG